MPWRPMTLDDIEGVSSLADAIHIDHPEDMHVFIERLNLYPPGCLVLAEDARLIGYALTHPWNLGEPPPLNSRLVELPRPATTYYIHDVALLPAGRGRGHAAHITAMLAKHAREAGFSNMSLVAVNGSQAFWEQLGFCRSAAPGLEEKLLSYGRDAVLMIRDLTGSDR